MSAGNYQNKLLLLAMGPVLAVTIYFIGGRVLTETPAETVEVIDSARTWLVIFSALYVTNFGLAWLFRDSWTATLVRLLVAGIFGYIAISETVTIVAGAWDFIGQLLGGSGPVNPLLIAALRYALVCWTVNLTMAVVCIGVGFESPEQDEQ